MTRRAERPNRRKRGMSLKWGRGFCTEDEDGGLWEGEKSRGGALTGPQYGTTGISIQCFYVGIPHILSERSE